MDWLATTVAAAGLLLTAAAAAAALRPRSPLVFLLATYLLASAELVLLGEALSILHAVSAAAYLVGEALLLAAAAAAWHLRGRPRPPLPVLPRGALRRHPLVAALAAVVAAAAAYELFLVLATPPDNWDSMTYHLARAAWWLQRGGFHYLPDPHTQRENAYQPNSELEILWSFALLHRDTLAAVPQWLAQVAGLGAVYGVARRIGFAAAPSAFAALLTATLTQIALQSVTTQNDLTAASFVAAAACLVLERTRTGVALAGLAVALALGTKLTAVFALPLLLALAAVSLPRRRLAEGVAAAAAAFVLVSLYGYALNLANAGNLLGEPSASEALRPAEVTVTGTISTAARIGYRFVDLPGYHPKTAVTDAIAGAGRAVFDALGIPANPPESTSLRFDFVVGQQPNEDLSFFGPLGILLVLPLSLAFVAAGLLRRTSAQRLVLALGVPVYAVELALAYSYNVWVGRFMVAAVLLTMPLAAWICRSRVLAGAAAVVGALTLALTHAYNDAAKPTGLERTQAQTVPRPRLRDALEGLDRAVPADARLGTVIGADDWEYPLFGPRLRRRLVRLPEGDELLPAAERLGLRYVVLNDRARRPTSAPGWSREDFPVSGWTLFAR